MTVDANYTLIPAINCVTTDVAEDAATAFRTTRFNHMLCDSQTQQWYSLKVVTLISAPSVANNVDEIRNLYQEMFLSVCRQKNVHDLNPSRITFNAEEDEINVVVEEGNDKNFLNCTADTSKKVEENARKILGIPAPTSKAPAPSTPVAANPQTPKAAPQFSGDRTIAGLSDYLDQTPGYEGVFSRLSLDQLNLASTLLSKGASRKGIKGSKKVKEFLNIWKGHLAAYWAAHKTYQERSSSSRKVVEPEEFAEIWLPLLVDAMAKKKSHNPVN
jgi:hypothetical protein